MNISTNKTNYKIPIIYTEYNLWSLFIAEVRQMDWPTQCRAVVVAYGTLQQQ